MNYPIEILPLTREYAENNAEKILALERNWQEIGDKPWTKENLLYYLPLKWDLSHVATMGENVVGYEIGSVREDSVYLNKIVVDKTIRNGGIGKKLLTALLEKSKSLRIDRIKFKVRTDNPAVGFYDKYGFTRLPKLDKTRPDGVASYFYDSQVEEVLKNLKNV